jgi:very-short-patch-repair endonuclease
MEGKHRSKHRRRITAELQMAAWQLREAMTPAEQVLWEVLRARQLNGLKFRRQHPVGQFILDFYCPLYKLVVELDGGIHETQCEQDAARTEHLEAHGYHVIRFCNEEVLDNLPSVLERIADAVNFSSPPLEW